MRVMARMVLSWTVGGGTDDYDVVVHPTLPFHLGFGGVKWCVGVVSGICVSKRWIFIIGKWRDSNSSVDLTLLEHRTHEPCLFVCECTCFCKLVVVVCLTDHQRWENEDSIFYYHRSFDI